jgi:hypothetical protein
LSFNTLYTWNHCLKLTFSCRTFLGWRMQLCCLDWTCGDYLMVPLSPITNCTNKQSP